MRLLKLYACKINPSNNTFTVSGSNPNLIRIYDYTKLEQNIASTELDIVFNNEKYKTIKLKDSKENNESIKHLNNSTIVSFDKKNLL